MNARANEIHRALFGDGTQATGLIRTVYVGSEEKNQNPQNSISAVLDRLGIDNVAKPSHHNHFHINLRPPTQVKIGGNTPPLQLNAETALSTSAERDGLTFSDSQGEITLIESILIPFIPQSDVLNQTPTSAFVAKAIDDSSLKLQDECEVDTNVTDENRYESPRRTVYAPGEAWQTYLTETKRHYIGDLSKAKITVVEAPKHGNARLAQETIIDSHSGPRVQYIPNPGFRGVDTITVRIELDGESVLIMKRFVIVDKVETNEAGYIVGRYSKGSSGGGVALDKLANDCLYNHNLNRVKRIGLVNDGSETLTQSASGGFNYQVRKVN